jgi:hypothetical protein
MAHLLNSNLTHIRSEIDEIKEEIKGGKSIKFVNKQGDVMVFTPQEARHVLEKLIHEEFELFADDIVLRNKTKITERIDFKLKQLEKSLIKHVDDKFDKVTEMILEATISRKIEEEVDKRLKQIKDKL